MNEPEYDGLEWYPSGHSIDELREFYRDGQCWYLALVLHRLTEWPIVVMGQHGNSGTLRDLEFNHAACLNPAGNIVDIDGEHTALAAMSRWGGAVIELAETDFIAACDIHFTAGGIDNAAQVAVPYLQNRHPKAFLAETRPHPGLTL